MDLQTLVPIVLKVSLLLSIFAIGLSANAQDAIYLFRRPAELARALLAMNVLMPLFAVVLVSILDLNPAVRVALVALSVSPVPPLLPMRMLKAGSTKAYAIGVLIGAAVLSIVFVPLAMKILELVFHVPLQMTLASIAALVFKTVLLPIGLGVLVHSFAPALAMRLAKPILLIASVVLLACVGAILIVAAPSIWTLIGNGTVIAIAAFVLAGLAIGHFLGGPEPENRTALAFSTASRHPAIAIAIAVANRPEQKLVMAAVLLYMLVNIVLSIPYQLLTRRWQPEAENQAKA